jgi:CCR4-NOT transcription complex subunit 7/8
MAAPPPAAEGPDAVEIREVWAGNLEEEFAVIRAVVDAYPYVAMDTEFPGFVVKPSAEYRFTCDRNYAALEGNVNVLKLIQLGLTLSNGAGALPPCGTGGRGCIWQFNFRGFDPHTDPSSNDSIDPLRRADDVVRDRAERRCPVGHLPQWPRLRLPPQAAHRTGNAQHLG